MPSTTHPEAPLPRRASEPGALQAVSLEQAIAQAEQAVIEGDARFRRQLAMLDQQLHRRLQDGKRWGLGLAVAAGAGAVGLGWWFAHRRSARRAVAGTAARGARPRPALRAWHGITWQHVVAFSQPLVALGLRTLRVPSGVAALPFFVGLLWPSPGRTSGPPVQTAAAVDLARYAGRWFEIARLPLRAEQACEADVSATYEWTGGRALRVTNRCRIGDGSLDRADGEARIEPDSGGARLKVTFVPTWLRWLPGVWAPYWILWVDDDYRAALVGTPDREHLWLLSRAPSLEPQHLHRMLACAREQGFDTSALVHTPHTLPAP